MGPRRRSRIRELSADPEAAGRQARELCLRLLTDRARTRHELAEILAQEEVPAPVASGVLDRLEELRLLDDEAYAEAFVRSRQRSGVARRSMGRELQTKGVPQGAADAALEQIDAEQERATALSFATRRAARTAGMPEAVRRRRLYGFLARRGYPSDVVSSVVDQVLGEEAEEPAAREDLFPDHFSLSEVRES
jgi:regulatory protein